MPADFEMPAMYPPIVVASPALDDARVRALAAREALTLAVLDEDLEAGPVDGVDDLWAEMTAAHTDLLSQLAFHAGRVHGTCLHEMHSILAWHP
jgi:hypothetical protein